MRDQEEKNKTKGKTIAKTDYINMCNMESIEEKKNGGGVGKKDRERERVKAKEGRKKERVKKTC